MRPAMIEENITQTELTPKFSDKDKITIIMGEYNSLRNEILVRTGHMYQLLVLGAGVLISIITGTYGARTIHIFLASVFVVLAFSWLIERDIRKAARRIREIERYVKQKTGENVLIWENQWGGARSGFFGPAQPLTEEEAEARWSAEPDIPWVGQLFLGILRFFGIAKS